MSARSAEKQLEGLIAKFSPEIAATARSALGKMRALLPGATEMVYDNYNYLAIGFGPNDRVPDVIFSITVYPRWVTLFFMQGAKLPDPHRLLKGAGSKVRSIPLDDADDLDTPEVRKLIDVALEHARVPMGDGGERKVIIKSIAATRRPRRPAK